MKQNTNKRVALFEVFGVGMLTRMFRLMSIFDSIVERKKYVEFVRERSV